MVFLYSGFYNSNYIASYILLYSMTSDRKPLDQAIAADSEWIKFALQAAVLVPGNLTQLHKTYIGITAAKHSSVFVATTVCLSGSYFF